MKRACDWMSTVDISPYVFIHALHDHGQRMVWGGRPGSIPGRSTMTKPGEYHSGPYTVVRYPTYYVVVDLRTANHQVVFNTRSRESAHKKCEKLNRVHVGG